MSSKFPSSLRLSGHRFLVCLCCSSKKSIFEHSGQNNNQQHGPLIQPSFCTNLNSGRRYGADSSAHSYDRRTRQRTGQQIRILEETPCECNSIL